MFQPKMLNIYISQFPWYEVYVIMCSHYLEKGVLVDSLMNSNPSKSKATIKVLGSHTGSAQKIVWVYHGQLNDLRKIR